MLKWKLIFAIVSLYCLYPNFAADLYSKFSQKDYKVDFQRTELDSYNKAVWNYVDIRTFKLNRTFPAVNFTFNSKINMSTGVEMVVEMYKFLSNEYRKMPGTRFQLNWCKGIKANIVGSDILYRCGNFTSCQIVQEMTYQICNAYPDESKFPPYVPSGEYKFSGKMVNDDVTVLKMALYIKIYRPVS